MKILYLDTNIYNDIYKDSSFYSKIKGAIDSNKYQIYLSPINFWEILSNPNSKQTKNMVIMLKELNPIFLKNPNECLSYIYLEIIKKLSNHKDININLIDNFKAKKNDIWYIAFNSITNTTNIHNISQKANKELIKSKEQQMCREYIYATFYSKLATDLLSCKNIKKGYIINNFFTLDIKNKFLDTVSSIKDTKINIDNNLKFFYAKNFKYKCKILNILKEDFSYIEIRSQLQYLDNNTYLMEILKKFYINPNTIIDSVLNNEDKIKYFTDNEFLIFYSKVITETMLQILLKKRHPKITEGDLFDWDQLVYSKIVDIFVTKDKRFYDRIINTKYNIDKFIYLDDYNKILY